VDAAGTSPSRLEIRRLVVSDAAPYRALLLDGYASHPDAFTASVAERGGLPLAWWESRIGTECVFGAWHGDRLVGVAGFVGEKRPKTRHKATLYGMYVDAGFGRRGIGERLVIAILDQATDEQALRIMRLTVTDGNRPAQALYERCGFVVFGVEPYAITTDDGYAAKVHMWLDLAARAKARHSTPSREASNA
jgi:ribosomal protein S18 acetylase RimI-like enzyme